jgi:hypothetical protein
MPSEPSPDCILTFTNRWFAPLEPNPDDIDVRDIAHSLSLLCRFNGHCRQFYSVAEHSVRVSRALPAQHALWGLLHDAAEAYLSDIPRPVKRRLPGFNRMEDDLLAVILPRFGLAMPMPPEVLHADNVLLCTEMRDLMAPGVPWRELGATPLEARVVPMGPEEAERAFLARFEALA